MLPEKCRLIDEYTLAAALDLSVHTIRRLTRKEDLPYNSTGSEFLYSLEEVITTLTKSSPELLKSKPIDFSQKYTYQNYLEIPEEPGCRFEVLDGELIREPSHSVEHQRVSRRLLRILEDYFRKIDPKGEVFHAPLDITLEDTTIVQPDILYVAGGQRGIIKEIHIDGAPTLTIEIISPSTRAKDRFKKHQAYLKAEVQHYWLVDPGEQTLQCLVLKEDRYELAAFGMGDEVVFHPDFAGLSINLRTLWQQ